MTLTVKPALRQVKKTAAMMSSKTDKSVNLRFFNITP